MGNAWLMRHYRVSTSIERTLSFLYCLETGEKKSPKVMAAKKYKLNRHINGHKIQNSTRMTILISWPPVTKSILMNCNHFHPCNPAIYSQTAASGLLY